MSQRGINAVAWFNAQSFNGRVGVDDTHALALQLERQRIRQEGVEALIVIADQLGAQTVEQLLDFAGEAGLSELRRILANWKSVHAEVGGDRRRG